MVSLEEYKRALASHDWHYEKSDDHSVWKAGVYERARLRTMKDKVDPEGVIWNLYAPKDAQ